MVLTRAAALLAVAAATAALLSGCSSSPAYCGDRTNLENSVKGLTSLNLSSGVSGLKAQLDKIQQDATTLVNSAKSSFPSETSAITSSVNALKNSVGGIAANPSAAQVSTITTDAKNLVNSVNSFMNASSSACG
jgi:hypothetical protein